MSGSDFKTAKKVVGVKQALKALENGKAKKIIIAEDAEGKILQPLLQLAQEKNVSVEKIGNMQELGKMCGIQVGASAVAILNG